jgi:pimeloyl-ACP methyl ester carboxylesterase
MNPRSRMLAGLPVRQRRVEIAGVSTMVLEGGDGPPLILLHGGVECGGALWAPVIAELAKIYRLIVPDVPGLGESRPVPRLDVSAFTAWFTELLRVTGAERPVLIAHSLLGGMAAHYASRHGNLLGRLVLYGVPAIGRYHMAPGFMAAAIRFDLRPSERNAERLDRWFIHDLDATRGRDPAWYAAFDAYVRERVTVPHVKHTMHQLIKTQMKRIPDAEVAGIAVPTDLLWGRHDRADPLRIGVQASARLGWRLHIVDGVGHAPHVELPDAFLSAIKGIEVHTAI